MWKRKNSGRATTGRLGGSPRTRYRRVAVEHPLQATLGILWRFSKAAMGTVGVRIFSHINISFTVLHAASFVHLHIRGSVRTMRRTRRRMRRRPHALKALLGTDRFRVTTLANTFGLYTHRHDPALPLVSPSFVSTACEPIAVFFSGFEDEATITDSAGDASSCIPLVSCSFRCVAG